MQYYPIVGDWERQTSRSRWIEWSQDSATQGDPITGWFKLNGRRLSMYSEDASGAPDQKFAVGRIEQIRAFRAQDDGLWGTTPGPGAVVDVWGNGIDKLATLAVTNQSTYEQLFC